jgi:protein-disulfide isomerase
MGTTKTTKSTKKLGNSRVFLFTVVAIIVVLAISILATTSFKGNTANTSSDINYNAQPRMGSADAPVKVIVFSDFKCPACKFWKENVFNLVKRDFIDTGKVQYYSASFAFLGPDSDTAAVAGEALFKQNVDYFWKYYDLMYHNQQDEKTTWATEDFIIGLVSREIPGVDMNMFKSDMKSKEMKAKLSEDMALVKSLHVNSTPAVFINGKKMKEPMDYNEFIHTFLDDTKATASK